MNYYKKIYRKKKNWYLSRLESRYWKKRKNIKIIKYRSVHFLKRKKKMLNLSNNKVRKFKKK